METNRKYLAKMYKAIVPVSASGNILMAAVRNYHLSLP